MTEEVQPNTIKQMWTNSLEDAKSALESAAELGLGIDISSEYHPAGRDGEQTLWWSITLYDDIPERDPDSEE
ncbi:hypothetical protein ACFZDK_13845 [Streptomyces sp. NPDC007901]|uniref:hypothetical protein n=1 Tax=Streptomyces sp. NPDC007901 TaxID=3364785 RepID=UPI0036EFBC8F